jgi:hypothetical protein
MVKRKRTVLLKIKQLKDMEEGGACRQKKAEPQHVVNLGLYSWKSQY